MEDRWEVVGRLFHELLALPADEREARLREACGDDGELRDEVWSLLESHEQPVEFLDRSPLAEALSSGDPVLQMVARDPMLGRRIGPYRIDESIGSGGMGTVYRASRADGTLERQVAVKVLHPWRHSDEVVLRFQREWQALAKLSHPNIAQILDAGVTEDGTPFLIMEYVDGQPVDEYCDARDLKLNARLALFEVIARAVHFAHQNLVVHRDLKPANILVTRDGVPKLLDFGIAKVLRSADGGEAAARTETMAPMMTPDYASPEQIRGQEITTATDVYSLGVVLYELLCGRRPYRLTTSSLGHIETMLMGVEPPRPSTAVMHPSGDTRSGERVELPEEVARRRGSSAHRLRRQLRGDLDNIAMMAMRREPERRYASALQLAEDVGRYRRGLPVTARPDTVAYRVAKFAARNRLAVAAACAAGLAALAGTIATVRQARIAEAEADHARIEASSSLLLSHVLIDAFLVSAPRRTEAELEDVRRLLARHVAAARREFAERDHLRANMLDALGRVYLNLDQFDEAEELIAEAALIRERTFSTESLEYALSLSSRGDLAYRRGQHEEAAEHFRGALALHRSLPRGVHTDVAQVANNLAVNLRLLGETDEAEELHREALALRIAAQGENHPLVAESLNNLSGIHLDREEYDAAMQCLRKVLAIRRASLGANHPLVAQTLNNLAIAAYGLGDRDAAVDYMRRAVERYRAIPGVDQEGLARALTNLAGLLRATGEPEEARDLARESLELHRRRLGEGEHPCIAEAMQVLAELEHGLGDLDEAGQRFAELLAMVRRLHPPGHPRIGMVLTSYATVLMEAGDPEAAAARFREAADLLRDSGSVAPSFSRSAEFGLGACLAELGRYAEAEPLLLAGYEAYRDRHEKRAADAVRRLREMYVAWGKPDRAAEFGKK